MSNTFVALYYAHVFTSPFTERQTTRACGRTTNVVCNFSNLIAVSTPHNSNELTTIQSKRQGCWPHMKRTSRSFTLDYELTTHMYQYTYIRLEWVRDYRRATLCPAHCGDGHFYTSYEYVPDLFYAPPPLYDNLARTNAIMYVVCAHIGNYVWTAHLNVSNRSLTYVSSK